MLQAIRGKVGSWIVKILFAVLILSFAVWGIGDLFRDRGPDQTVAEVAGNPVSAQELDVAFQDQVNLMRRQLGADFTTEMALRFGLLEQALQGLVTNRLLDAAATDIGLAVPDDLVALRIRQQPAFQNALGEFDPALFRRTLAVSGLTEPGYVALVRSDVVREMVLDAVGAGAVSPDVLAKSLYRQRRERRVVDVLAFDRDSVDGIEAPTEEALVEFYESRPDAFTAPEYRAMTVVDLSAADLAEEIAIDEDTLRQEYEARLDSLTRSERRRFDQVILDDEDQAARLAAAVGEGRVLSDALAESDLPDARIVALDWTTRDGMLPQLAEAAFSVDEGGVAGPVESPFGWHVLVATDIEPGGVTPYDEARSDILRELQLDQAFDAVFEVANALEDARAGGASLAEAAQAQGLSITEVPPIASDLTPRDGASAPAIESLPAIVATGFSLDEGEESPLQETAEGGFYAVRLDSILPPAVRPLAEVRDEVEAVWLDERRQERVRNLADEAAERIGAGEDPSAVAESLGATVQTSEPLLRDGSNAEGLPSSVIEAAFAADRGAVSVVAAANGLMVVRLNAVEAANPSTEPDTLEAIRAETTQAVQADLIDQFLVALQDRYGVEVNRPAVDRMYDGTGM
ncbi:MAG: SurA N-terminal domain-containing protein [Inquilinaceae bacterium]